MTAFFFSYPKKVLCNACGWRGRRFFSDVWHKYIICPQCGSCIRHRLFISALDGKHDLPFKQQVLNKKILHFAPEEPVSHFLKKISSQYFTADFIRRDCDYKLDISNMTTVEDKSLDVLIALDVLEHVEDWKKAVREIHRVLVPGGLAILAVPQKDGLATTYEDASLVAAKQREEHFGQWDHLRIYGNDFPQLIEDHGFAVKTVDHSTFAQENVLLSVLRPPIESKHPLATNHRKIFFATRKTL